MVKISHNRAFSFSCDRKENDHEGTRTLNLPIRSRTPYPLGHAATPMKAVIIKALRYIQGENKNSYIAKVYV